VSNLGKLFTSVINQRLLSLVSSNDFTTGAQFGFIPGHSTTAGLLAFHTHTSKLLSNKEKIVVLS
jgi:hypothetical protein